MLTTIHQLFNEMTAPTMACVFLALFHCMLAKNRIFPSSCIQNTTIFTDYSMLTCLWSYVLRMWQPCLKADLTLQPSSITRQHHKPWLFLGPSYTQTQHTHQPITVLCPQLKKLLHRLSFCVARTYGGNMRLGRTPMFIFGVFHEYVFCSKWNWFLGRSVIAR